MVRFNPAGDRAELNLNWEQVPNEDSRITLDAGQVDPVFGQPVVLVDWRLRSEDKRTAVRAAALAEAYLRRHGATKFRLATDLTGGPDQWLFGRTENALATGDHHMGALRMSADPEHGIVNSDSRFHRVDNLYTAGVRAISDQRLRQSHSDDRGAGLTLGRLLEGGVILGTIVFVSYSYEIIGVSYEKISLTYDYVGLKI